MQSLSTAGKLFTAGALLLQNSQLSALDFFENVDADYGIDPYGPVPLREDENGVIVPDTSLRFSDADIETLRRNVDPCSTSENHGMDLYEQTLQTLTPL